MAIQTEGSTAAQPDLRLFARFDCAESARIQSDKVDKAFPAKVVDVGLGGVQLVSRDTVPVDQVMTLRIEREGTVVVKVAGKAKYCTEVHAQGGYVIGFKFMPETHEERVAIAEFVHGIFQRQWEILS